MPGWQHFVWTDVDGISYDIDGVFDAIEFGISDTFLERQYPDYLELFKHRGGKGVMVTDNLLNEIRNTYLATNLQKTDLKAR